MLAAAPALEAAGVRVASVAAFVPQLPMLLQGPVGGVPLDLLLGPTRRSPLHTHDERALAGIEGAAAALAALHGSGMITGRTRPVADELARMQQRSECILPVAPAAGAALHGLARSLPSWLPCLPESGRKSPWCTAIVSPASSLSCRGAGLRAAAAAKLRCWTSTTAAWRTRRPTPATFWPRCDRLRLPRHAERQAGGRAGMCTGIHCAGGSVPGGLPGGIRLSRGFCPACGMV